MLGMEVGFMNRALACLSLFALISCTAFSQSTEAPAKFELADVHVSPKTTGLQFFNGGVLQRGRYVAKNATMLDLISAAYGVDNEKVQGGPTWLEKDHFDVIAKAPASTTPETVKPLLQSLLAERFKLVVHNDTKPMPVFVLTAGKGKPKLKEAVSGGNSGCDPRTEPPNPQPLTVFLIVATCHDMSMEQFAPLLRQYAGGYLTNPVIDSTGLKGNWDFEFRWSPRNLLTTAGADGISIFDAMDKQLGLKLEAQKTPQAVVVVDSVNEKPTENSPEVTASLPPAPPAEFEVAVIKPSAPDEPPGGNISGGQVSLQATPLKFLIAFAWNLNPNDKEQMAGAPKWLDTAKWDIIAKTSADVAATPAGPGAGNTPQMDIDDLRHMLQVLLIERFKMKVHMEDREISAYTLTAVNPKLRKADPTNRTGCKEGPGPDGKDPRIATPILARLMNCQNMTMAQFAEALPLQAGGYIFSPVKDATGLEGAYDFVLSFSPAGLVNPNSDNTAVPRPAGDANAAPDPSGALSLFDAVYKQLGLKLEKQKRMAPVLVMDHIDEKPTDN
jgi:uncharacterized protein (TIGR03435 family)